MLPLGVGRSPAGCAAEERQELRLAQLTNDDYEGK
jgi:hypothetical protein